MDLRVGQVVFVNSPDAPRTKLMAKIQCPLLRSRKTFLSAHAQEGFLGVIRRGHHPTGLCGGIPLGKTLHHTCWGGS